jgi:hypothetical protein
VSRKPLNVHPINTNGNGSDKIDVDSNNGKVDIDKMDFDCMIKSNNNSNNNNNNRNSNKTIVDKVIIDGTTSHTNVAIVDCKAESDEEDALALLGMVEEEDFVPAVNSKRERNVTPPDDFIAHNTNALQVFESPIKKHVPVNESEFFKSTL